MPRFLTPLFLHGPALAAGFFLLAGCATYQSKVSFARQDMARGEAAKAAEKLKVLVDQNDGDQLVYLLDYATALQAAGQLKDSTREFIRADRLADQLDYHSVSRVAGSLLLNEEMKQYKGDTFEKVFINAQLALNELEQGHLDDALVEARRINEKYQKLRADEKKNFELNPFAKYLSAVTWEADRKYDDALIDYATAYKISPGIGGIREDLIRTSKLAQRPDEYKKWKQEFPNVAEKPEWYDKNLGEIVIVVQQGWGPRKIFSSTDARFPALQSVYSETRRARATVGSQTAESVLVYDVDGASRKTLDDDRLALLGRRVGGIVAKDIAADQIRQKNELLGAVAWIALHASDRADLRQWSTLPETVQFIRLRVKPGVQTVQLEGLNQSGAPTGEVDTRTVNVKAGRKSFILWRTYR